MPQKQRKAQTWLFLAKPGDKKNNILEDNTTIFQTELVVFFEAAKTLTELNAREPPISMTDSTSSSKSNLAYRCHGRRLR